MIKKVVNIAALFVLTCLFCINTSYAQAPQEAQASDQEWAYHEGNTVTIVNVESYTYVELEKEGKRVWIAAPSMEVKVGDKVWASKGIEMRDHYSKALDRTFPVIHFVGRAQTERENSKEITRKETKKVKIVASPVKGSIAKAKGGYTLKEIFNKKEQLRGKKVAIKGVVMSVKEGIMGKSWFHLQDGTGTSTNLDLVVTSNYYGLEVGDLVTATGVLGINKDFGQGYKYNVILEDAEMKAGVIDIDKPKTSAAPKKGSILKAKGGYTLKEVFKKKKKLEGKKVVIRGKVVKASGKIMGKRWFHLQDGTGNKGVLDLVLTSDNDADAGDIVLVTGVLELGKDFGQGYKYDVIIEDAKIKIE